MKKAMAIALSPILLLGLLSGVASAAAPKAGATCTKAGLTATSSGMKFTCIKSGNKLVWDKGVLVVAKSTPTAAPNPAPSTASTPVPSSSTQTPAPTPTASSTPTKTPTPTPSTTVQQTSYYVAKDQENLHHLVAKDGCANPLTSKAEIQVQVGDKWLSVKPINSGWYVKSENCPVAQLGKKDSLAWADVYLDPGVTFRWYFKGEVNIRQHDNLGNGFSESETLPVPVFVPIPISLPVAKGEITFENILDNVDKVARVAYESAQKIYLANTVPTGMKSTIWVGPNTIPVGSSSEEDRIAKAMKFWSGFNQPKSIGLFFFNTQDEPLAEIAYDKWVAENKVSGGGPASMMRNDCLSNNGPSAPIASTELLKDCRGANAGVIDAIGTAKGWFGVPTEADGRADRYRLGALEIHEFTHMVQTAQFVGNSKSPGYSLQSVSPCWLQEGQAHFAGKTVASNSYSDYLQQRNGEAKFRTAENNLIAPKDLAGVSAYLSLETLATCQSTYSWGYATGMLAVEALSAIGGATSTMALYALEARGFTFPDAFKMVYGISWQQAQPILAQVIVKDYLVESMNG